MTARSHGGRLSTSRTKTQLSGQGPGRCFPGGTLCWALFSGGGGPPGETREEVPDGEGSPACGLPVAVEVGADLHEVEAAHARRRTGHAGTGGDFPGRKPQRV